MGLARDMTYRDRPVSCPRCGVELAREGTFETWTCAKCRGALMGVGELVRGLVAVAPELVPEGSIHGVTTIGRRTIAPALVCPQCSGSMEPVFLGGVDLDRCYTDELVWFDLGEHDLVLDIARSQRGQRELSWVARLATTLFGDYR